MVNYTQDSESEEVVDSESDYRFNSSICTDSGTVSHFLAHLGLWPVWAIAFSLCLSSSVDGITFGGKFSIPLDQYVSYLVCMYIYPRYTHQKLGRSDSRWPTGGHFVSQKPYFLAHLGLWPVWAIAFSLHPSSVDGITFGGNFSIPLDQCVPYLVCKYNYPRYICTPKTGLFGFKMANRRPSLYVKNCTFCQFFKF